MTEKIAIYGAGGQGREVQWLIEEINRHSPKWEFIGFFDDNFSNQSILKEDDFLGNIDVLNNYPEPINIVLAFGYPNIKQKVLNKITNPLVKYPTLIHPSCLVGNRIEIGEGVIICAGTILTTDIKLDDFVSIGIACQIGHDAKVGAFTSLMPCVTVSGEVAIGELSFIGTGAKIIQQITIGSNTIIGSGAVVTKSIPSNCTAVGVPAKVIKQQ